MKDFIIVADSMTAKVNASRNETTRLFGTWFKRGAETEFLIAKCDKQIAKYKNWIRNLEQLRQEQLKFQALAKKDEIRAYLSALDSEELRDIMAETNSQFEDAMIIED